MPHHSLSDLLKLNSITESFEQSWRDGGHPRIEAFLRSSPPRLRDDLLDLLLGIELEIRREKCDPAHIEEYLKRFPADLQTIENAFKHTASET